MKRTLVLVFLICCSLFVFSASFPSEITLDDSTYYLHSTDSANVGETKGYEGAGALPLSALILKAVSLGWVKYDNLSVPAEVYNLMGLEAQRSQAVAKLDAAREIDRLYTQALEGVRVASTSSAQAGTEANQFNKAWRPLIEYLDATRINPAVSSYERSAALKYLKDAKLLSPSTGKLYGWTTNVMKGNGGQGFLDALSKPGKYQILKAGQPAIAASSVVTYTESELAAITARINTVKTTLPTGYTATVGQYQGMEILKDGKKVFSAADKVGNTLSQTRAIFSGAGIDDAFRLTKYVSGLQKLDLFLLSKAGEVGGALQKVQSARSVKEEAAAISKLNKTVARVNNWFQASGVTDVSFEILGTGKASKIKFMNGAVVSTFSDAEQLVKIFDVGGDAVRLSLLQRSGLALKYVKTAFQNSATYSVASKVGAWFMKFKIISWPVKTVAWVGGKVITIPVQVGMLTFRLVTSVACSNILSEENTLEYQHPANTVFYLNADGDPSLRLFADFDMYSKCMDAAYSTYLSLGAGSETGQKIGTGLSKVYEFMDLSALGADGSAYLTTKMGGLNFKQCSSAVYSKQKPAEVKKISDPSLAGAYSCIDGEENVLNSGQYPIGEYVAITNISLGSGAADSMVQFMGFKPQGITDTLKTVNQAGISRDIVAKTYDGKPLNENAKFATQKLLGICTTERGAVSDIGLQSVNIAQINPITLLPFNIADKDLALKFASAMDDWGACVQREGMYTEYVKFEGSNGGKSDSPQSDTLTINTVDSKGATVNLVEELKKDSGSTTLTEDSLAKLMSFYKSDASPVDATISVKGGAITIKVEKDIIAEGSEYILRINLMNKDNKGMPRLIIKDVKRSAQQVVSNTTTYSADVQIA